MRWNELLTYIKSMLGAPVAQLELPDDQIIDYIKLHTLRDFSVFVPLYEYTVITDSNLVNTFPKPIYELPVEKEILVIKKVYHPASLSDTMAMQILNTAAGTITSEQAKNILDTVIRTSIVDYFSPVDTWTFKPPKRLEIDSNEPRYPMVVEYGTIHSDDLSTIPSDMFIYFKRLACADIMLWLASARSKFESLQTGIGTVNLNWQQLYQVGTSMREEVTQSLRNLPPEILIEWLNE